MYKKRGTRGASHRKYPSNKDRTPETTVKTNNNNEATANDDNDTSSSIKTKVSQAAKVPSNERGKHNLPIRPPLTRKSIAEPARTAHSPPDDELDCIRVQITDEQSPKGNNVIATNHPNVNQKLRHLLLSQIGGGRQPAGTKTRSADESSKQRTNAISDFSITSLISAPCGQKGAPQPVAGDPRTPPNNSRLPPIGHTKTIYLEQFKHNIELLKQQQQQPPMQQQTMEQNTMVQEEVERRMETRKTRQQIVDQQQIEQQNVDQQNVEQRRPEQQNIEQQRIKPQQIEQQYMEQQTIDQRRMEEQRLQQQQIEQQRREQQRNDHYQTEQQHRMEQQQQDEQQGQRKNPNQKHHFMVQLQHQQMEQQKIDQQQHEQQRIQFLHHYHQAQLLQQNQEQQQRMQVQPQQQQQQHHREQNENDRQHHEYFQQQSQQIRQRDQQQLVYQQQQQQFSHPSQQTVYPQPLTEYQLRQLYEQQQYQIQQSQQQQQQQRLQAQRMPQQLQPIQQQQRRAVPNRQPQYHPHQVQHRQQQMQFLQQQQNILRTPINQPPQQTYGPQVLAPTAYQSNNVATPPFTTQKRPPPAPPTSVAAPIVKKARIAADTQHGAMPFGSGAPPFVHFTPTSSPNGSHPTNNQVVANRDRPLLPAPNKYGGGDDVTGVVVPSYVKPQQSYQFLPISLSNSPSPLNGLNHHPCSPFSQQVPLPTAQPSANSASVVSPAPPPVTTRPAVFVKGDAATTSTPVQTHTFRPTIAPPPTAPSTQHQVTETSDTAAKQEGMIKVVYWLDGKQIVGYTSSEGHAPTERTPPACHAPAERIISVVHAPIESRPSAGHAPTECTPPAGHSPTKRTISEGHAPTQCNPPAGHASTMLDEHSSQATAEQLPKAELELPRPQSMEVDGVARTPPTQKEDVNASPAAPSTGATPSGTRPQGVCDRGNASHEAAPKGKRPPVQATPKTTKVPPTQSKEVVFIDLTLDEDVSLVPPHRPIPLNACGVRKLREAGWHTWQHPPLRDPVGAGGGASEGGAAAVAAVKPLATPTQDKNVQTDVELTASADQSVESENLVTSNRDLEVTVVVDAKEAEPSEVVAAPSKVGGDAEEGGGATTTTKPVSETATALKKADDKSSTPDSGIFCPRDDRDREYQVRIATVTTALRRNESRMEMSACDRDVLIELIQQTCDKDLLTPEEYVDEVELLMEKCTREFRDFYIFVTRLQIGKNRTPISFIVYMHLLLGGQLTIYYEWFLEYCRDLGRDPKKDQVFY